jgi:hypothetical protein
MIVNHKDRNLLRNLAQQVAEIAARPEQEERRQRWYAHNRLEHGKPLVFCSPEGSWMEILPQEVLQAEDPLLRGWEYGLRMRLYIWEHFQDDEVIDNVFSIGHAITTTGWGLQPRYVHSGTQRGAYVWEAPVKEPADLEKLHPPETTVDAEATRRNLEQAQDLFGDLLDVRLHNSHWWSLGLIGEWAQLRGLEQIMLDMCENPEFTHRAMRILTEGKLQWLQSLEDQGLLSLNNGNHYVGSGGFGFTHELPAAGFDGEHVRLCDMWGFAEAQEISGVSPAMHEEFVLQYQLPVLERFGLNCYGCCEPLHHKLDLVKKVPRLRRVSISPWADLRASAEALQDRTIFSWKPNPADLAAVTFDPDRIRAGIREMLEITRDCIVEIILKDTHTCNHEPERFDQWTQITQEEAHRAAERG